MASAEYQREYKRKRRLRDPAYQAAVRVQNRRQHLMRKYGLRPIEYKLMFERQGGRCAICGQPERARSRDGEIQRLAIDHDHKTGKVRGLLCYKCNVRLGAAEDKPWLKRALDYLDAAEE